MAEHYSFFDAVLEDDGVTYDREYNAQQFTNYFGSLITTGVMKGEKNELKVTANGSSMITKIDTGVAFIQGRYYENDSQLELTHDTETLSNSRIDRIVVRMDLSTEARYVKAFIKKGVPSTNPVAPTLTQTPNLYEISLAQVKIVGGQTFIDTNAVTDERGKDVICPWTGSKILPNFDDDALEDLINQTKQLNDSKANKVQENWINGTTQNGWTTSPKSSSDTFKFYKDDFGVVHIVGIVEKKSSSSTIFSNLPVGYRPKGSTVYIPNFAVLTSGNVFTLCKIGLSSDGSLVLASPSLNSVLRLELNISIRI